MSATLKPCHCGYQGVLLGVNHQGVYFSLSCPECRREATAFTMGGLVDAWNKPACPTCGDLGEINRRVVGESDFKADPCPDCPPQEPRP